MRGVGFRDGRYRDEILWRGPIAAAAVADYVMQTTP
jgi:hypothetical protein